MNELGLLPEQHLSLVCPILPDNADLKYLPISPGTHLFSASKSSCILPDPYLHLLLDFVKPGNAKTPRDQDSKDRGLCIGGDLGGPAR